MYGAIPGDIIGSPYEYDRGKKTKVFSLGKAAEWYRIALEAGYEPDETEQEHLKAVLGDEYQQK